MGLAFDNNKEIVGSSFTLANWNYKSQQIIGTNTWIADWSLSLD